MEELPHVIIHKTTEYPTGLKSANEIAGPDTLPLEKLIAYAESGYLPHYRIDGGDYLFKVSEVKSWISKNLMVRCNGADLPFNLKITVPAEQITEQAPFSICNLKGLQQVPKYGFNSGVYFLCWGTEVVYVGQSTNPSTRIASHVSEAKKIFDRVYLLPVPEHDLNNVEGAFIDALKPKYQGGMRSGKGKPLLPPMTRTTKETFAIYEMEVR